MNPGQHRCAPLVTQLVITFAVLIAGVAQASEPTDVSNFIKGLELGCGLSEELKAFRSELNARYTFEAGSKRLQKGVNVPKPYAKAVGRVLAFDRGEYTEVVVPLNGIYRGLHTRSLIFDIGHSNGVNVIKLVFDAARSKVNSIIGRQVAETQREFEADPQEKDFGFSVQITDAHRGSVLICNLST
ncbi:hypothetical protein [Methylobacterium sp. J-067]|uniref:hypothetical protein n=1 Tax=Methylobacterium sp. J-067 TaxID=2836648 RepID=UPI001FBC0FD5|nr:hypothetical protein [Methylobacterium sp. J-067]MCJ2023200.1 hypothetical protein [Methylobacterium sp. J-067]